MSHYTVLSEAPSRKNERLDEDELDDDYYFKCANLKQSRHSSVSDGKLFRIRFAMAVLLGLEMGMSATANTLWDFWYYQSSWGLWSATSALVFCMLGANHPIFQNIAVIMTNLALCLALVITPLFWVWLAPLALWPMPNSNIFECIMKYHMGSEHLLPLVFTIINLYYSDIHFPAPEFRKMFVCGMIYGLADAMGDRDMKITMYPGLDWSKNWLRTVGFFILQGIVFGIFSLITSHFTKHRREEK